jgi:MscS family membrane protein
MSKQVIELLACSAIALAAGRWLGRWAHRALYRGVLLTRTAADDKIVLRLAGPLSFLCGVTAWEIAVEIALDGDALAFARALGSFGLLVVLAWTGMRVIDSAVDTIAAHSPSLTQHRVSQSLLPLARRIAKVIVAVIVAVMVLSDLGYAVGPLVVALGVVGVAVALAAQKTLENVFGAFAIGVDHPFREGDFIRLDNGLAGTVEAIGLRSSRVRTLDRTTVTIPNGKLADAQIETLTERDRVRFELKLKLELTATAPQLERLLADIRAMLFSHPQRGLELPSVHLVAITDACFELELVAWFAVSWPEFEQLRDHLLVRCVDAVGAAGVALHGAPPRPVVSSPRTAPTTVARSRGGLS